MPVTSKKKSSKKFITDDKGDVEFVIVPVEEYNKLIELIEDYGLGLAMEAARGEGFVTKEEALRLLEDDKD